MKKGLPAVIGFALIGGLAIVGVTAQTPPAQTTEQRVAALKKSLADSAKSIRRYEWVETTIVSLKGEEKSRKQLRCYYGADGKIQKVPVGGAAAPAAAAA